MHREGFYQKLSDNNKEGLNVCNPQLTESEWIQNWNRTYPPMENVISLIKKCLLSLVDSPHKRPLEQQAITCSCIDCACIQRHLSSAQNPSSASLLNFIKHPTQCCNTLLKRWITNYVVRNLFRKTNTKNISNILSFPKSLKSFFLVDNFLLSMHSQHYGLWWPGKARDQGAVSI